MGPKWSKRLKKGGFTHSSPGPSARQLEPDKFVRWSVRPLRCWRPVRPEGDGERSRTKFRVDCCIRFVPKGAIVAAFCLSWLILICNDSAKYFWISAIFGPGWADVTSVPITVTGTKWCWQDGRGWTVYYLVDTEAVKPRKAGFWRYKWSVERTCRRLSCGY